MFISGKMNNLRAKGKSDTVIKEWPSSTELRNSFRGFAAFLSLPMKLLPLPVTSLTCRSIPHYVINHARSFSTGNGMNSNSFDSTEGNNYYDLYKESYDQQLLQSTPEFFFSHDIDNDEGVDRYYDRYKESYDQHILQYTNQLVNKTGPSIRNADMREQYYDVYKDSYDKYLQQSGGVLSNKGESEPSQTTHQDTTIIIPHERQVPSFKGGDKLSHVDEHGSASMVDVGDKSVTDRIAVATGTITLGAEAYSLVSDNKMKKGDVLTVAQLAGIMAAKDTSRLIPLCHSVSLNKVDVRLEMIPADWSICVTCTACTSGKTGVEMEALTGVSVALLSVYDMCKAVTHDMVISNVKLEMKSGGKRHFKR